VLAVSPKPRILRRLNSIDPRGLANVDWLGAYMVAAQLHRSATRHAMVPKERSRTMGNLEAES